MSERVPISTEARAKVRAWKRKAIARFERIDAVIESAAFQKAGPDFTHKKGKGRLRALPKVKALLAEAHFERAHLEDPAFALWSFLRPRNSVICPGEGVGPAKLQDCVTVDYVAIGHTWDHMRERVSTGRSRGLWTLEIRDHALGRLAQRDPYVDFDEVIFKAHREVLRTRLVAFKGTSFLTPAGVGACVCSLTSGTDKELDRLCVCVSARTLIHADQIVETQPFAEISARVGERLGDNILLPVALHHWMKVSPGIREEAERKKSATRATAGALA